MTQAVLRCDIEAAEGGWDAKLLETSVAGLPLIQRHLMALREAGVESVHIQGSAKALLDDLALKHAVSGIQVSTGETRPAFNGAVVLEQRADTLIDPRLLKQLLRFNGASSNGVPAHAALSSAAQPCRLVCVDRHPANYSSEAKSPYRVGAPDNREARAIDGAVDEWHPIGVELRCSPSPHTERVDVGRYYWHRFRSATDAAAAAAKILLSTMKPTDGIYARTNRRVSLAITKRLLNTPVSPNMVTLFTLLCSMGSGFLFAVGSYPAQVAGAFVSWFASMLDGVDGELARSRFQHSDFGCWLEMVCDYLYYIFVFSGIGIGLWRASGNAVWMWMGFASVAGVLLSFACVAWLRRLHAKRESASDFGRAFQSTVGAQRGNPLYRFSRLLGFLATRAALPYYIFLFTAIGGAKILLGLICFGTNVAWPLLIYSMRLFTGSKRPPSAL